ncbi:MULTISPECIES: hypothetical protein [Paraburkholderia]|uniref:Uncharacterized protein n=1 Tax=Paraburkholderia dioscoreae TaxID=2604047 RepID=A0A5Q4Z9A6_9BURK|nr:MULTISPECIES: hypothetical protein [Paraburkholderia]MDR8398055.1 hypothetical protein [Paraburkholderia sp. USG1]VVD28113.1 conserved protein of unknown function [Paraburkholderia dioscoreae]
MKFVEAGNFSGWVRITLFVVGLTAFGMSLALDWLPRVPRMAAFLLGFGLMALGGISSRAHMLNIKPFDNSYKKARESYKTEDDKHDEPK